LTSAEPIDLDPNLAQLEEFEHGWQLADGLSWGRRVVNCDDLPMVLDLPGLDESTTELPATTRRRKRKEREHVVLPPRSLPLSRIEDICADEYRSPEVQVFGQQRAMDGKPDWAEEAKRRKAWWRSLIRSSPSSGQLFSILPRVCHPSSLYHSLP